MRKVLNIFIALCVFASAKADEEITENEELVGWLAGKDTVTGQEKKFYFAEESAKRDIIVKDMKDVSVHCEAHFPVELDFDGNSEFKFHNVGSGSSMSSFSNGTHELEVEKHAMFAFLPAECSQCTGRYICKASGEKGAGKSVSSQVHFPTDKLFVSSRTAMISSDSSPFIIPCAVGEPSANVTLVKMYSQKAIRPVPYEKYDPTQGFTLVKTEDTSEGTFYCIAKHDKFHRAVEYSVIKGEVKCPRRCGENSQCAFAGSNDNEQICQCKPGYEETLVSEKCLKPCKTDENCEGNMACLPQETGSFLLDILSLPEGRMVSGDEDYPKRGTCKNPCIFTDSKCGTDEECHVVDHKPVCGSRK